MRVEPWWQMSAGWASFTPWVASSCAPGTRCCSRHPPTEGSTDVRSRHQSPEASPRGPARRSCRQRSGARRHPRGVRRCDSHRHLRAACRSHHDHHQANRAGRGHAASTGDAVTAGRADAAGGASSSRDPDSANHSERQAGRWIDLIHLLVVWPRGWQCGGAGGALDVSAADPRGDLGPACMR